MGSVHRRELPSGDVRWDVRYRDLAGRHAKKTFRRRREADQYLADTVTDQSRGDWIDPRLARTETVGAWAKKLVATKQVSATTAATARSTLAKQVMPRWEHVPLAAVRHVDIVDWVADLSANLAPATVKKAHNMVSQTFDFASRAGVWRGTNPCKGVKLPAGRVRPSRFLSAVELEAVVAEISKDGAEFGDLVLAAAYLGLRRSEVFALRPNRIDLERGRVSISGPEAKISEVSGQIEFGPSKNRRSREIPILAPVVEVLERRIAGLRANDLLWTDSRGGPWFPSNFYRCHFAPAVERAMADRDDGTPGPLAEPAPWFHDLRHTFAAWMCAADVNPKALQRWMGHSSISVTLDTYGHLMASADADNVNRANDWLQRL